MGGGDHEAEAVLVKVVVERVPVEELDLCVFIYINILATYVYSLIIDIYY